MLCGAGMPINLKQRKLLEVLPLHLSLNTKRSDKLAVFLLKSHLYRPKAVQLEVSSYQQLQKELRHSLLITVYTLLVI